MNSQQEAMERADKLVKKIQRIKGNKITDDIEILRTGLLDVQVCSSLNLDETLKIVRSRFPSGTIGNWGIGRFTYPLVQCDEKPTHKHFAFSC